MIAFVLSGGNNYGAMQAGALLALAEAGIKPDIVVGTSTGAINGMMAAYEFSPERMARLGDIWRNLSASTVFSGNYASALWRLARGENGLFSRDTFKDFLRGNFPSELQTFADLKSARMYAIATEIPTGRQQIFGENPDDPVLDALLASAALPPLHPTYQVGDSHYIDGALSSKFPLRIAIEKGATTIYALHLYQDPTCADYSSSFSVTQWAIGKLLNDRDQEEMLWATQQLGHRLHYIQLRSNLDLPSLDFSNGDALIEQGYVITKAYLETLEHPQSAFARQWEGFKTQCAQIGDWLNDLKAQFSFSPNKSHLSK